MTISISSCCPILLSAIVLEERSLCASGYELGRQRHPGRDRPAVALGPGSYAPPWNEMVIYELHVGGFVSIPARNGRGNFDTVSANSIILSISAST